MLHVKTWEKRRLFAFLALDHQTAPPRSGRGWRHVASCAGLAQAHWNVALLLAASALWQAGAASFHKSKASHAFSQLIQDVQVSLIGEHSDFVCSGSDGGSIFIWNAKTGQLVNVLRANETVTTCVAPHPHVPMLASCGFEPAVRLWSPEVGTLLGSVQAGM